MNKLRGKDFEADTGIGIVKAVEITGYTPITVMLYMSGNKFSELFCRKLAEYKGMTYSEFKERWVTEDDGDEQ